VLYRRMLVSLAMAALLAAVGATSAAAGPPPMTAAGSSPSSSAPRNLSVTVNVTSFRAAKTSTTARGNVSAVLQDSNGHATRFNQPVTLSVKSGGSCKILGLVLDQLKLNLLGLNVNLDKVNLQITGRRSGGVLGSLFCKLANTKVKKTRVAAARKLTARVRHAPLRPLQFTVPLKPVTAAQSTGTPTCQVLNLILGPLNLDLLGLVVDLQKVNLNITASRGQGQLGDIFCQLADDNQSGAPQQ
jgi:hypothetical protein